MFGMIMPDKKVPNFCTAIRAPPVLLGAASALAVMLCLPGRWPSGAHANGAIVATLMVGDAALSLSAANPATAL
jgi:hypothetical protein